MSRRHNPIRRSPREWAAHIALAAGVAVLGGFGVTFSVAQAVVGRNPAFAYRLAPYDGRITAAYATSLAGVEATAQDYARAETLAQIALRQNPTVVAAAATLGVNADIRGDTAAARRFFAYASLLSRRDLRTQLWNIEEMVRRNDVAGALQQYDITLRVSPAMGDLLYPVLVAASSDPNIRTALIKTLAAKPVWGEGFISFLAARGTEPRSNAALLLGLRRAGVAVPAAAQAGVVNALAGAGHIDAAWSYYATLRSGVDRRRSRDPEFTTNLEAPSSLDWEAVNDGIGLAAVIRDGVFDFSAPASVSGPMLQQMQLLQPGKYRLVGRSTGIDQLPDAHPYWMLRCSDGRELGRVDVPNSTIANGDFSGTFAVPAGCPVQVLVLVARPSDAVAGLSGQIERVELAPVRG